MIGNTNTRFHWGQTVSRPAIAEPPTPFQGTIYPDGHPWQTSEIQALTGSGYSRLPVLNVSYYNNTKFAGTPVKTSITPAIDFDLNSYRGIDSPDASAGVSATGYSIRWNGFIQNVPSDNAARREGEDSFVFFLTSDDVARLSIGSDEVIDKKSSGLATRAGACKLPTNQRVPITVEYTHSSAGPAGMHVYWLSRSARENIIQIVP
jgi:hypothetical protein